LGKPNKLVLYKSVGYEFDEDYDLFLDTLVTNVEEDADLIEFEGTQKKK
jgi:hypothetical protein